MRVYHLLKTKWGFETIRTKRMRISRFSDLNDPFELLGANLRDKQIREAFGNWKHQVSQVYGLLCFSRGWGSPLLWSHYGDRHRGVCLGFDLPDEKAETVRYLDRRIEIDESALDEGTIIEFLTTKFVEWSYEQEVRVVTDLTDIDPDDGNYYVEFGPELQLREVIVGALSDVTRDHLMAEFARANLDPSQVEFTKARLAFKSYAVVRDKRELR